jgi:NAD dependent epimerase/dehydratase family enzyme
MPTPAFAMRLALGEMADILLHGQRVIPKQLQDSEFTFAFTNAENALQDLQTRKA